jgi:hypothetical protein
VLPPERSHGESDVAASEPEGRDDPQTARHHLSAGGKGLDDVVHLGEKGVAAPGQEQALGRQGEPAG